MTTREEQPRKNSINPLSTKNLRVEVSSWTNMMNSMLLSIYGDKDTVFVENEVWFSKKSVESQKRAAQIGVLEKVKKSIDHRPRDVNGTGSAGYTVAMKRIKEKVNSLISEIKAN